MSISNLLSRLVGRQRERELSAEEAYQTLVQRLADGENPSEQEAQAIIDGADHTAEQLAADVARVERRKALLAIVRDEPTLRQELSQAGLALQAEQESFAAAKRGHDAKCKALREQCDGLEHRLNVVIAGARTELRNTAPPELKREATEARQVVGKLARAIEECEADLQIGEQALAAAELSAQTYPYSDWPAKAASLRENRERIQARLTKLRQNHLGALATVEQIDLEKVSA